MKKKSNNLNDIAFHNVLKMLDVEKYLPENVFRTHWRDFLFFSIEEIFEDNFFDRISQFLIVENSSTCCLLNLEKYKENNENGDFAIFFNELEKKEDYINHLKKGGAAAGWLYRVDSYGCASEIGEWGIFCDKENDIAILGFKDVDLMGKYQALIDTLGAKRVDDLLLKKTVFPFCNLAADWESRLVENYS